MIPSTASNSRVSPEKTIRFPDFDVSWVGAGPTTDLLCFGSDDGELRLAAAEGILPGASLLTVESKEAINDVAFYGRFGAVSTRDEVVLFKLNANWRVEDNLAVFSGGAHGVIATAAGQFIAPLGRSGLLVWKPEIGDLKPPVLLSPNEDDPYYFYRVISLNGAGYSEVLVSATRRGGVAATAVSQASGNIKLSSFTFPGLDVIDVCTLDGDGAAPAVAALGRDRTLVFSRDVRCDFRPVAFSLSGVEGTAYSLLSAKGHIFLLTSRALYVLRGLTKRFLEGEQIARQSTVVREIPLEAVDIHLVHEQWLFIVMADHTLVFDVEQLIGQESNGEAHGRVQNIVPTFLTPDWRFREEAPWATTVTEAPLLAR